MNYTSTPLYEKSRTHSVVGFWSEYEDAKLLDHISRYGESRWNLVGRKLNKSAWECCDRYLNHLRSTMFETKHSLTERSTTLDINNHTPWRKQEDAALLQLRLIHGSNWDLISNRLTLLNESDGLCLKRKASDVQRHYRMLTQHLPLQSQENRLDSTSIHRNSLVSWSTTDKIGLKHSSNPSFLTNFKHTPNVQEHKHQTSHLPNQSWRLRLSQIKQETEQQIPNTNGLLHTQNKHDDNYLNQLSASRNPKNLSSVPVLRLTKSSLLSQSNISLNKLKSNSSIAPNLHSPVANASNLIISRPAFQSNNIIHPTNSPNNNQTNKASNQSLASNHQLSCMDDAFTVQTPTKALSEADQLSFHLASPPAVIGNHNLVNGGNSGSRSSGTNRSHLAEVDGTPTRSRFTRLQSHNSGARSGVCTRLFDSSFREPGASNNYSRYGPGHSSSSRHHSPHSDGTVVSESKCLAYLTAKATVWNRALLPLQANNNSSTCNNNNLPNKLKDEHRLKSPFPSLTKSSSSFNWNQHANGNYNFRNTASLIEPMKPLKFPSGQQPQLNLRRVVQIGYEDEWREVSFGRAKVCQTLCLMARNFVGSVTETKPDITIPLTSNNFDDHHQQHPTDDHNYCEALDEAFGDEFYNSSSSTLTQTNTDLIKFEQVCNDTVSLIC